MELQLKGLSKEAQYILYHRCGYRNDNCYNSGEELFLRVMNYEVFELGNTDILHSCKKIYRLNLDLRKRKESIRKINQFFCSILDTNTLFCKWLATKENVYKLYSGKENCTKYRLNLDSLIASDLGPDGVLFVSFAPFESSEM